jgi:hypothetical protein
MPTDMNTAIDLLRGVQLRTKPPDGLHPIHQAEQLKAYALDLADCHPEKRQRLARERSPGRERRSLDASDPWDAPYGLLGVGLQVVRGAYLLAEQGDDAVPAARARFNSTVSALGLGAARRIAELHYRPGGDHEAVRRALEDAVSLPVAAE